MTRSRREQRVNYDAVAVSEEGTSLPSTGLTPTEEDPSRLEPARGTGVRASHRPSAAVRGADSRRPTSRQYSRISLQDDSHQLEEIELEEIPPRSDSNPPPAASPSDEQPPAIESDQNHGDHDQGDGRRIRVVVLDVAHKKFAVSAHPDWTVATFKDAGMAVHKVPPALQRLIFRGKMMTDTDTLSSLGITEDDVIVHLFPKPRVVITESNSDNNNGSNNNNNTTSGQISSSTSDEETGARVPTIVMNAEEAERRHEILVLGSTEFIDAQNNVKLFSFMLLIISSIELMNLLALALGVPDNNNSSMTGSDDFYPHDDEFSYLRPNRTDYDSYGPSGEPTPMLLYQEWGPLNYVDMAISALGVYVALIGLKASNATTLHLAKVYLVGTFITGVAWLLFNYFLSVKIDQAIEEQQSEQNHNGDSTYTLPPMSDGNDNIYQQALQVMVLPGMVWFLCCFRAWQFHAMLQEAEQEATSRVYQSPWDLPTSSSTPSNNPVQATPSSSSSSQRDPELAVNQGDAVLT